MKKIHRNDIISTLIMFAVVFASGTAGWILKTNRENPDSKIVVVDGWNVIPAKDCNVYVNVEEGYYGCDNKMHRDNMHNPHMILLERDLVFLNN